MNLGESYAGGAGASGTNAPVTCASQANGVQWPWNPNYWIYSSVSGSAQSGRLSANALLDTTYETTAFPTVEGGITGESSCNDLLTFSSPPGATNVTVRVTLILSTTMQATLGNPASGENPISVTLHDAYDPSLSASITNAGTVSATYLWTSSPNSEYSVNLYLGLSDSAHYLGDVCSVNAVGTFYLDVLTPGTTVQSVSGFSYATPLKIVSIITQAGQVLLQCSGPPETTCDLLSTTNCVQPTATASAVATGTFDLNGSLTFTSAFDFSTAQNFFLLRSR